MWPTHCVQGTDGGEYHPNLQLSHTDTEVLKGQLKMVESYSAFGGDGEVTGLKQFLRKNSVQQVFVVGLAYDYCVGSTANDAALSGFKTFIV